MGMHDTERRHGRAISGVDLPAAHPLRTLWRAGAWLSAFASFALRVLWDIGRRRDCIERRAMHLRVSIQGAGGTLVKLGQQLSLRLDLLPEAYCTELAKMLDQVPPFPTTQAVQVVERTLGRRLGEVFANFEPTPIGSASIACVYRAVLHATGEPVIIKVRRPGIRDLFAADFKLLDWITTFLEALTIVRPGTFDNVRRELRVAFAQELDLRIEARFQELFLRRTRKLRKKHRFITAPRVFHEVSGEEALVQELVSGVWVSDILKAVEKGDEEVLARMRELRIEPAKVAKRILFACYWGIYKHVTFHADPHPANILVRADNEVVFIDFGACGTINKTRREQHRRFFLCQAHLDTWGMTQAALTFFEPYTSLDMTSFAKDIELLIFSFVIAVKSKHSHWYERTTAYLWVGFLGLLAKHKIPAPRDILLLARGSLLYDTLACRLHPRIDIFQEFRRFAKLLARDARRRIEKRLTRGVPGRACMLLEEAEDAGERLLFRLQRWLSVPYDFVLLPHLIEKTSFAVIGLVRLALQIAVLTVLATVAAACLGPRDTGPWTAQLRVIGTPWYQALAVFLVVLGVRKIMFRIKDPKRTD
jgi:ubiquinone biosynthesis protein